MTEPKLKNKEFIAFENSRITKSILNGGLSIMKTSKTERKGRRNKKKKITLIVIVALSKNLNSKTIVIEDI